MGTVFAIKNRFWFVLAAVVAFSLSSKAAFATTTLHPGDKISITVYNHPELSTLQTTPTAVDASGHIWMPVAGLIDTSNLGPESLASEIAQRLAPYVRHPAVDVQLVSQAQSVFVTGVASGVFPFSPGETLLAVLNQVEMSVVAPTSPSYNGAVVNPSQVAAHELQYGSIDLRNVVIERDGKQLPPIDAQALIASGQPAPTLQPDDTIELAYKPVAVTVRGDVRQPGVAHLDPGQPLSDAIYQVGGADDASAADTFDLTRGGKKLRVSKSSPEYQEPAQMGDVVYVPHGIHVGVVGSVAAPGRVLLEGDSTLLSALYFAGGPTKYGDIRHVRVIHDGQPSEYDITRLTHGAPDQNPQLADGDTLFVPEGHRVDFSLIFSAIIAGSYLRFL
jgi:protein involved in polysaccharide export with SLBB domain